MKVQLRVLILTAILGTAYLAGLWIYQQNQRNQAAAISNARRAELSQLFKNILSLEDKELGTIVFDYTYWDELVQFVKSPDPAWARETLDSSLSTYQINVIWVYNPDLNLIYSTTNLKAQAAPPIPLTGSQIKALFKNGYLTSFSFRLPDGTVMEVQGATVHGSADIAHQSPAEGYFFAGRVWSADRLNKVSELTSAEVKMISPAQANQTSDPGQIVLEIPVAGADGNPIAYLRGTFSNGYTQGLLRSQANDLSTYLLFTIILLAVVGGGLFLWVSKPLNLISNSLASGNTTALEPLQKDKSEYGRIARLIQDFFHQRQEMKTQIDLLESAETALRVSELRYRTITEIVSDAAYSYRVQADGSMVPDWGAEAVIRVTGYNLIDLVTQPQLLDCIHPDDRGKLLSWQDKLTQGEKVSDDVRIFNQGGGIRYIHNQMVPVMEDGAGRISRVYGSAQDITATKEAEEAYRTLVENSIQGLAIYQDWVFKFANPAFSKASGYSAEELTAMSEAEIDAHLDPETANPGMPMMDDVLNHKVESASFKLRFQHKSGAWRWMDVFCEPIEYQGLPALQLTTVDVTEHILAEDALRKQTDYSNILFNTISSLVVILDPQGNVSAWNPAAAQLTGWNSAETGAMPLWKFFGLGENTPLTPDYFARLVGEKSNLDGLDLLVQCKRGFCWLSWSQRYQLDAEGRIAYVIGTAVDISQAKIRDREREAIAGIATALRGSTTRQETIMTVLERVCDFMGADSAGVAFPVAEMEQLLVEYVLGNLQPVLEGKRLQVSDSIIGQVWSSGKPYFSNDLGSEKKLAVKETVELTRCGAFVPLVAETNIIGVLFIAKSTPMTQEDLALMLPIADLASGAIDRAERTEQAQRRIRQLSALQSINLAIGSSLDLHVTLNILAVQMTTQLGVDAVDILQLNPNTKMLRFAAGHGFRSREVDKLRLWLGESQAGRAAVERRSRHLYDPEGIAGYFTPTGLFKDENFVAYDAIPLVVKGEVKGVIEAYHRPPYNASNEWQQLLEALALETAIAIDNAELLEKLQRSNQDLLIAHDQTIEGWARSLELYDLETENHSRRVVEWTVRLAQWVGISGENLRNIRRGALLHDIGKIAISRDILNKPAKLNEQEWELMRQHPVFAREILYPIPFLRPSLEIPYGHHERWDGSGYPEGLKGEQIPLAARLFAVIDIYDAVTNPRSYRAAWTEEVALEYLKNTAGKELDPQLVRAFLDMVPILKKTARAAAPAEPV